MILSDNSIEQLCSEEHDYRARIDYSGYTRVTAANDGPMIAPYYRDCVREMESQDAEGNPSVKKVISYGQSAFGYDVKLADEFSIFSNVNSGEIDPKEPCEKTMVTVKAKDLNRDYILVPPNSYILGRTEEYFRIPRDIMVVCVGKSTYARAGAIVNVTPIEPGFEGQVVIEISNATNLPMRVYVNEGIAQFLFFLGEQPCRISYGDRDGKYQGQTGITHSKV